MVGGSFGDEINEWIEWKYDYERVVGLTYIGCFRFRSSFGLKWAALFMYNLGQVFCRIFVNASLWPNHKKELYSFGSDVCVPHQMKHCYLGMWKECRTMHGNYLDNVLRVFYWQNCRLPVNCKFFAIERNTENSSMDNGHDFMGEQVKVHAISIIHLF